MEYKPEKDEITGVHTTGHAWDGVKELNNPLPRWWLIVMFATMIWAMAYTVFYPAWPGITGYTKGVLGYTNRNAVMAQVAAAQADLKPLIHKIATSSVQDIKNSPDLLNTMLAAGGQLFALNCSPCHGAGGQGAKGYPNLRDDDWLWGGTLPEIEKTIRHGVRNENPDSRSLTMPSFGRDGVLDTKQINQVADFVLSLSGTPGDKQSIGEGKKIFTAQCSPCHGANAEGGKQPGAPRLSDNIWLYSGKKEDIIAQVRRPKHGKMPDWSKRLDDDTIKLLAMYVSAMSGGL